MQEVIVTGIDFARKAETVPFWNSNFSVDFSYVAASEDRNALESSFISAFEGTCASGLGMNNIAVLL